MIMPQEPLPQEVPYPEFEQVLELVNKAHEGDIGPLFDTLQKINTACYVLFTDTYEKCHDVDDLDRNAVALVLTKAVGVLIMAFAAHLSQEGE